MGLLLVCSACRKELVDETALVAHWNKHVGAVYCPYCRICNRTKFRRGFLIIHMVNCAQKLKQLSQLHERTTTTTTPTTAAVLDDNVNTEDACSTDSNDNNSTDVSFHSDVNSDSSVAGDSVDGVEAGLDDVSLEDQSSVKGEEMC